MITKKNNEEYLVNKGSNKFECTPIFSVRDEDKYKRDKNGRFVSGGGSSSKGESDNQEEDDYVKKMKSFIESNEGSVDERESARKDLERYLSNKEDSESEDSPEIHKINKVAEKYENARVKEIEGLNKELKNHIKNSPTTESGDYTNESDKKKSQEILDKMSKVNERYKKINKMLYNNDKPLSDRVLQASQLEGALQKKENYQNKTGLSSGGGREAINRQRAYEERFNRNDKRSNSKSGRSRRNYDSKLQLNK